MWERLGQTTAMALWTHLSLCGDWYPVSTRVTWGLPSAACGLPLHTGGKEELAQGLSIGWFPCQGSRSISGGTPPHPDLARQVHLPCDPHCSLLSSWGRCSRRPAPAPQPHLVLLSLRYSHGRRGTARAGWMERRQPAPKGAAPLPCSPLA